MAQFKQEPINQLRQFVNYLNVSIDTLKTFPGGDNGEATDEEKSYARERLAYLIDEMRIYRNTIGSD